VVRAVATGSPEAAAAWIARLRDSGEQTLRGRAHTVRVWTGKPLALAD
jgi:hypothetical protein